MEFSVETEDEDKPMFDGMKRKQRKAGLISGVQQESAAEKKKKLRKPRVIIKNYDSENRSSSDDNLHAEEDKQTESESVQGFKDHELGGEVRGTLDKKYE